MTNFESEIENNGYVVFTNKGDSMMPLLRENKDLMVIRKITRPLKRNDAVLFKRENGAYVLHRIIKVYKNGLYRIGGDNRSFSELIPSQWIVGILDEIIKGNEHIRVTDKEYKKYLRKLPIRRFYLKAKAFKKRAVNKIKRTFFGGK